MKVWRGATRVVAPVMRKASDIAMAPYGHAERGYLTMLPAALRRPWLVLGLAGAAFVGTVLLVPMLGADLIPQLAQDRFEMTVKLPSVRRWRRPTLWCASYNWRTTRTRALPRCMG